MDCIDRFSDDEPGEIWGGGGNYQNLILSGKHIALHPALLWGVAFVTENSLGEFHNDCSSPPLASIRRGSFWVFTVEYFVWLSEEATKCGDPLNCCPRSCSFSCSSIQPQHLTQTMCDVFPLVCDSGSPISLL